MSARAAFDNPVTSDSPAGADGTPTKWVQIFSALAYLFFLGALTHVFGSDDEGGSGPFKFLFLPLALLIQLVALGLLFGPKRSQKTIDLLKQNQLLVLATVFIIASTAWSIDPAITLRRALALVGTTAVGLLIYVEIGRRNLLRFFAINLALFMVASVIVAIVLPQFGTHTVGKFAGDWRGLLSFKNQAAWASVIFILVWLGTRKLGWMKSWNYPLLALGLIMVIKTGSATGIYALSFGILVYLLSNFYRRSPPFRPLVVAAVVSTAFMLALNFEAISSSALEALGRDESLTGRTSVWAALWPLIESKIWLGSGYLAFWAHSADYLGSSSWMVDIGHAHNAYIQILLDVGVIGLLTQIGFLLALCWRLFRLSAHGDNDATAMLGVVLTLAVIGIAGALFFRANTGTWVMLVAIACYAGDSPKTQVELEPSRK